MGASICCLGRGNIGYEVVTPDPQMKRQQMLDAAERRRQQEDSRGLKNPERFYKQQRKRAKIEKATAQATSGDIRLKWQVG